MSHQPDAPEPPHLCRGHRSDVHALGAFLLLLGIIFMYWFIHDGWLTEYDILSYFLPWYGHLGDRLRSLDIPGWMPWLSSGSPFAGDPSGGWWYLPAMLTFTVFNVATGFKAMILLQCLLGGVATYLLARSIGLRPVAALVSTVAYVFGPFLAGQMMYGTVAGQVSAWLPLALLGVEWSLRASRVLPRVAWWALTGLSISQIAVSWPGQGMYNSLLLIGGWVAYRAIAWPPDPTRTLRSRLRDALATGPAILALGMLLGAAGFLPRLQTSSASNIPNGDYSGVMGGDYLVQPHSLTSLLGDTLVDDAWSRPVAVGAPVVVLALVALVAGRGRYGIPFFALIVAVAGVLSMDRSPLHEVFYVLPGFENIHTHSPRRLIWVCFIAPALLAGAGLEALLTWRPKRGHLPLLLVPFLVVVAAAAVLERADVWIGWWTLSAALLTSILTVVLAVTWQQGRRHGVGCLGMVSLVVLTALSSAGKDILMHAMDSENESALAEACLETYVARSDIGGAGEFLQLQQVTAAPFRYVGYAGRDPSRNDPSYSFRRCEQGVLASLIGGRAVRLELETIQGYNPLHLGTYSDYIVAMNGGLQDYHWVDPYPSVLESSHLMNMLNVRFIIVALDALNDPRELERIAVGKTEVFRDADVVIFENHGAFPRAWVVHEVRPDADGLGLRQIAVGLVDGRRVAYVDGTLPNVQSGPPTGRGDEEVTVVQSGGDALTATVRLQSDGLVVFSEVYAPGWVAYVDGERTEILRTNHSLRGVAVSAGAHTIEMRYEPATLRYGLAVSGVTAFAVVIVLTLSLSRRDVPCRLRQ